jgi:NAD(P)-dependent dehydrogenase (short-subunit alcohol dehydrogenase family)
MVATIPPKVKDKIVAGIPLRRFAKPDEIARAALFILQNDYFDGRILEIDGGFTHRFKLDKILDAYDTFGAAAKTHALKVLIEA